jgi:hypothetical protein
MHSHCAKRLVQLRFRGILAAESPISGIPEHPRPYWLVDALVMSRPRRETQCSRFPAIARSRSCPEQPLATPSKT